MSSEFNLKPTRLRTSVLAIDFMLSVFLVTLVEIKTASTGVGGNRGIENGVVHLLMGLIRSSFILEQV